MVLTEVQLGTFFRLSECYRLREVSDEGRTLTGWDMAFSDGHLEVFFRPIVDPRDEQVRIYRAVPVLNSDDGSKIGAKQVLAHDGDPMDTAERNAVVLQHCAAALAAAHSAGNAVFLMLPISAKALETKESSTAMVKVLKDLPDVCAKAAISHVFDLPDRVTLDTLDDVVVPLLITIDKFVLEPPAELEDYTDISSCNAQGVVLDMAPGEGANMDLTKLWSRAAPRRLGIFVQNADNEDIIPMAERYEGRGVDGPVFGKLLHKIGPRASRGDLAGLE